MATNLATRPGRAVLCGGVAGGRLPVEDPDPLPLALFGPAANVHLKIQEVSRELARDVPDEFLDLLDLAAYVYAADQATSRGGIAAEDLGRRWRRRLYFRVPVRRPDFWTDPDTHGLLTDVLSFLTDDEYLLDFRPRAGKGPSFQQYLDFGTTPLTGEIDEVVMFSGGLDSLAGAVEECVNHSRRVLLLNHRSSSKLAQRQLRLVDQLSERAGRAAPVFIPVWANKAEARLLLAGYLETVNRVVGADDRRFFSDFAGELGQLVRHVPGVGPEEAGRRSFALYRRHAEQVSGVIDAAIRDHAPAIRERSLPDTCLLRQVTGGGVAAETGTSRAVTDDLPCGGGNYFRRHGRAWLVGFAGGQRNFLLATQGAAYLHRLLGAPDRPVSAVALALEIYGHGRPAVEGAGVERLDPEALRLYRERAAEVLEELAAARDAGDAREVERLQRVAAALAAEIGRAKGLGKRTRLDLDGVERTRKAVGNAIRRLVWDAVRSRAAFVVDGRTAAEVVRVLASGAPAIDRAYPRTLFPAAEAYAGRCTAKTTGYAAGVTAALMVGQFARWLRGLPVVPDQVLNLLAAELTVPDPVAD